MIDFNEMTGPQLVEAYNAMVESVNGTGAKPVKPVKKFENLVTGIHRCQALKQQIDALGKSDIPHFLRRYDLPEEKKKKPPTTEAPCVESKEKTVEALVADKPALANASKVRRADRIIRVIVDANPRRRGSEAHKYFEAMVGGPTVGEYLAKFPAADQRKAAQWLWNTVKDGFAKLLG